MADDSITDRDTIEQLAESFVARFRAGERPSVEEYARRYPQFAAELRELFPALVLLEQNASLDDTGVFGSKAVRASQAPKEVDDFTIVREIGRGGMGVVYEAVQRSLGRHVALKVLSTPGLLNPSHLERFRSEARAAARLHHTHIVPVFGVGEHNGIHYYAMQFIQGQSLDLVIDALRHLRHTRQTNKVAPSDEEPFSRQVADGLMTGQFRVGHDGAVDRIAEVCEPDERLAEWPVSGRTATGTACATNGASAVSQTEFPSSRSGREFYRSVARIGLQVAEALAYAHAEGILHRDIKPSNLLLDAKGNVWITDFGLAKTEGTDGLTQTGDFVGTLRYMAPERLEGWSDRRSDLYSLGASLYELLTLMPYLQTDTRGQLVDKILHETPPPPSKADRLIPRDLETIVLKAIAKEPASRYHTAEAMVEDLQRFLADRSILARRSTPTEQFVLWCRRNPLVAGLTGTVAALLMVAVVILSLSNAQVRRESAAKEIALIDKDAALKDRDQALVVAREKEALERSRYYAAQMNLASQAWKGGQHVRTVELLETLRPRSGEPDARGFEWYYLYRLSHPNVICRWRAHWRWVTDIAWNPDGSIMATASLEPAIRLWDGQTSKFLANLPTGGEWGVWEIAWSNDGSTLAAACQNGEVVLWDMPARRERRRWMVKPEPDGVWALAISPDGSLLATDSYGVKLWNVSDGSLVAHLPGHETGPRGRVMAIAFSPDGTTLASADSSWAPDPSIILWDLKAEPRKLHELQHMGAEELIYSEDGNTLWAASKHQILTIDVATGEIRGTFPGPNATPTAMAALPGSQQLVTASEDHTVRLWDLKSGKSEIIDAELSTVRSVTANPKGEFIAWGDNIGQIVLRRSAARETNPIIPILPSKQWVRSIQFTPDSRSLVVCTRPAQLIDVATLAKRSLGKTQALSISRDATLLAEIDDKNHLTIRNLKDDLTTAPLNVGKIDFARFSPDGKLLAAWDMWEGTELQLWDTASGKLVHRFGPYDQVINAAFSPDSNLIAISNYLNYPRNVGIYDLHTKKRIMEVPVADSPYSALHLLFSPDGSELAVGLSNGEVLLLDVAKDSHALSLRARLRGHFPHVNALAFSPNGRTLATAGAENSVRLWDLETLQERITVDIDARQLAFSPDGNLLAAIDDQTIVRWLDATADPSAKALRTWRDRADFDQFIVGAYAAWESGDEPQAEEKLLAAIRTLEPEASSAANINVFDRLVRCQLHLHLLRKLERRTTEAQQSLEKAKQLLAEMPDYQKQLTAARFRAEGPKSAAKDRLADALFAPAATNDN